MKITKREHACLDILEDNSRLIIDPGVYSNDLTDFAGVTAVVVTHVHADHLDESKILKITQQNPAVQIFCTEQVAAKLSENFHITVPSVGAEYKAGAFTLQFYGGQHAFIFDTVPQDQNFGVLVNETLYYPGDSLAECPEPHIALAVPSMAPWLKTSEAVDFIRKDSAQHVFPTHTHFMSADGFSLVNSVLGGVSEQAGKTYHALEPGKFLEV